ncbi:MAG: hypothetical protein JSW11_18365 [Candidatus Heimdallarchaeota archaeon]|nr:MAG: hypothetical protein JSW11_18365 [Candidatus Heimdallarchaeota archaeon]
MKTEISLSDYLSQDEVEKIANFILAYEQDGGDSVFQNILLLLEKIRIMP